MRMFTPFTRIPKTRIQAFTAKCLLRRYHWTLTTFLGATTYISFNFLSGTALWDGTSIRLLHIEYLLCNLFAWRLVPLLYSYAFAKCRRVGRHLAEVYRHAAPPSCHTTPHSTDTSLKLISSSALWLCQRKFLNYKVNCEL